MRISTKLALLASFFLALSFGVMTGIARADESNQTKINVNTTENSLTMDVIDEYIAQESIERDIIEIKKVAKNNNLPSGEFIIEVSAYTAAADECGKSDGITASGKKVKENETIACPKNFAFGTKLNIKGYGTYICTDRGGAIKGNKIDIYMKTKAQAFAFGRQKLVAQIVTE